METVYPAPITTDILQSLPDLRQITRFCTADEISTFLRNVNTTLEQDRQRMSLWNSRLHELDHCIDSTSRQELRKIHDELNQIELERFLLQIRPRYHALLDNPGQ